MNLMYSIKRHEEAQIHREGPAETGVFVHCTTVSRTRLEVVLCRRVAKKSH